MIRAGTHRSGATFLRKPGMSTPLQYLKEAANLCLDSMASGRGGPFGAIIVKDDKVVGKSANRVFEKCDPTAHAEVEAIRDACSKLGTTQLAGATMYCTGEPCPMCMAAIYWAQIDAVVFANTKEESAAVGFDDTKIYAELALNWKSRALSMVHLEEDTAKAAFAEWKRKAEAGELLK
jgi:tRNA(Arg) A34 adenosine deaminase TadA